MRLSCSTLTMRIYYPATLTILFTLFNLLAPRESRSANIYRDRVNPQWAGDNSHFWYRNDLAAGTREYILVDLEKGVRQPAFNQELLATALNKAGAGKLPAAKLQLEQLQFHLHKNLAYFRVKNQHFQWHRGKHQLDRIDVEELPAHSRKKIDHKQDTQKPKVKPYRPSRDVSPDGKWRAYIKEHNLFVRPLKAPTTPGKPAVENNGEEIALSTDGTPNNSYQAPYWSPNSNNLISFRVEPGKIGDVHLIESSPKAGGRAKLQTRRYPLPGDKFNTHELNWFDIEGKAHSKPKVGIIDFRGPALLWTPEGRYCRYQKIDRGHQRFRIIELDTFTGKHRNIVDETTDTFIWTEHAKDLGVPLVNWLRQSKEIIHISERDGWRHLYLIDIATGKIKNQITKGKFVVRYVDRIDEDKRQVWFRASGRNPDHDPYLMHYYRVNFDGTHLTALTEGNGWHNIRYSPDQRFLIDSYSRVDMPPVHELRRATDGKLVCELEKADVSELKNEGWSPPEVFSAKGRDGETDIWGFVSRPRDFDPKKQYPVLEEMYAGPHDSYTPKQFSAGRRYSSWTDMGFVVVKMDGMGTANRSKAFHDVCWQNLKDAGFPDRILWHKAFAKNNPWYDISRVGIFGGSAGGQSSTGALLFHPDFYKVAVSSCGCHDNRMDKASWNEQWMGYPVGPHYSASSNIDNAHRLQGRLLLIVGELDRNVPPESTYRLVDALIKAGKDFDFIMVPGGGHGGGGRHGHRRRQDFFRKHLLDIEPPNYNVSR
ncbi:MAG: prolyl oligopeptidase family serine peptidase [Verrucomicrobiaceae bacterium]|nr:prolyl oligopeptidase family serine peptidase [Verrucomicrobiaceae bacterium]